MNNSYEKYATVIIITTIISLAVGVIETRANLLNIQQMAKYSLDINKVINTHDILDKDKELKIVKVSSTKLVPGDVFEIPEEHHSMPCDSILVSGKF